MEPPVKDWKVKKTPESRKDEFGSWVDLWKIEITNGRNRRLIGRVCRYDQEVTEEVLQYAQREAERLTLEAIAASGKMAARRATL